MMNRTEVTGKQMENKQKDKSKDKHNLNNNKGYKTGVELSQE